MSVRKKQRSLIIFDLDDTLIETSKCLTPLYLKLAFDAMVEMGLKVEVDAYEDLLAVNQRAISSRAALIEFWSRRSNAKEILNSGFDSLKAPLPKEAHIELVPEAKQILDTLEEDHTLALVTAGDPNLQLQKMKKAGIQPQQFSKLIVSIGSSKKLDYQRVLEELKFDPSEAIACGDRIEVDLTPARELGLYTVHFKNGRGLFHSDPKESVDLTIKTLKELQEVFVKYEI